MSNKLEKSVRDPCLSIAKKHAGVRHKRMHFGHGAANGWPDDLFYFQNGHHWWVEFKGEGKEASPLQAERHREMREFLCDVSVIADRDVFQAELRERLTNHTAYLS